jgi:hypothetical protein
MPGLSHGNFPCIYDRSHCILYPYEPLTKMQTGKRANAASGLEDSEADPIEVPFAEPQRLGPFTDFGRR